MTAPKARAKLQVCFMQPATQHNECSGASSDLYIYNIYTTTEARIEQIRHLLD